MKRTWLVTLLAGFALTAQAGTLRFHAYLQPVASFWARNEKLAGYVLKSGESYTAHDIEVAMTGFQTGISLRDRHLATRYLEAEANPKATFRLEKADVGLFEGRLTWRGKTLPIFGRYDVKDYRLTARFKLRLSDFGIAEPEYMGVKVLDEVDVEAELPILARPPA